MINCRVHWIKHWPGTLWWSWVTWTPIMDWITWGMNWFIGKRPKRHKLQLTRLEDFSSTWGAHIDLMIEGIIYKNQNIHKDILASSNNQSNWPLPHFNRTLEEMVQRLDIASDHELLIARLKIKIAWTRQQNKRKHHRFNVLTLKDWDSDLESHCTIAIKHWLMIAERGWRISGAGKPSQTLVI